MTPPAGSRGSLRAAPDLGRKQNTMKTFTTTDGQKVRAEGAPDAIQKLARKLGEISAIHFHGFDIERRTESASVFLQSGNIQMITVREK